MRVGGSSRTYQFVVIAMGRREGEEERGWEEKQRGDSVQQAVVVE